MEASDRTVEKFLGRARTKGVRLTVAEVYKK